MNTGTLLSSSQRPKKTLRLTRPNEALPSPRYPEFANKLFRLMRSDDARNAACCQFRKLARAIKYSGPMAFLMTSLTCLGFGS